jgi:hypothetical protein
VWGGGMYSTVRGTDECVANLSPGIHEAKMSLIISRSIILKWMIFNTALLLESVN